MPNTAEATKVNIPSSLATNMILLLIMACPIGIAMEGRLAWHAYFGN
jgi:hypothetical protein